MQLDERAVPFGVTFLDDTSDDTYFLGMKGVHAVLESFTTDGWMEPAGPDDEADTDFASLKNAPNPVIAENGNNIHFVRISAKNPTEYTPTLVMLTGFTEMAEHMLEVAYYYWQAGYAVYILEHRGHGRSPRDVDDLGVIWIDDFRRYVADAEKLIHTVVQPYAQEHFGSESPVYVYGHSMGGGVALALAEHAPTLVDKYVLTCPMVAPQSTLPGWITSLFAHVGATFKSKKRIIVQKDQLEFNTTFDEDYARGLSHARALWLHTQRCAIKTNQMYAAAYGWMRESLKLTKYIRNRENEARIQSPILMFQAENDAWVSLDEQNALIADVQEIASSSARKNPITKCVMPAARHELEAEQTQTFHTMIDTMLEFLAQ